MSVVIFLPSKEEVRWLPARRIVKGRQSVPCRVCRVLRAARWGVMGERGRKETFFFLEYFPTLIQLRYASNLDEGGVQRSAMAPPCSLFI